MAQTNITSMATGATSATPTATAHSGSGAGASTTATIGATVTSILPTPTPYAYVLVSHPYLAPPERSWGAPRHKNRKANRPGAMARPV